MTPVFAHGRLRLYLLALLEEAPRHGYEVIRALEDRFGGTYSPSAGTVYPRLARLEDDGLVERERDGRRSVYRITDAGRAEMAERRPELDDLEQEVADSVRRLAEQVRADVRTSVAGLRAELAAAAQDARRKPAVQPEDGHPSATSRSTGGTPGASRAGGRRNLRDAEAAVRSFRDDVRADLRAHAGRGDLDAATARAVQAVLEQARSALLATLRGG